MSTHWGQALGGGTLVVRSPRAPPNNNRVEVQLQYSLVTGAG